MQTFNDELKVLHKNYSQQHKTKKKGKYYNNNEHLKEKKRKCQPNLKKKNIFFHLSTKSE